MVEASRALKPPRKSCDFCYTRKIKCDGQKPHCSHCISYAMDCTYAAPSRKSKPRRRKGCSNIDNDPNSELEVRVGQLESLIQKLSGRPDAAGNQSYIGNWPQNPDPGALAMISPPTSTTSEEGDLYPNDTLLGVLDLPPLKQVQPILHHYLHTANTLFPLFHAQTLLQLTHNFYTFGYQERDPVPWAVINAALALAHRYRSDSEEDYVRADKYQSKAQSVLSVVVLGETQLLHVQVMLGMAMLSICVQDFQSAVILIATTVRLAHKIGLHNRASSAHLDPAEIRQRSCVFWLTYILDKRLSMYAKQPSLLLDDDIDLDLPSTGTTSYNPDNETALEQVGLESGVVYTVDGTARMNFLLARIQLAVVEGGVYDFLYSVRSQKRSHEERARALISIDHALELWQAAIPPEFSARAYTSTVSMDVVLLFHELHAAARACKTAIKQVAAQSR